MKNTKKIRKGDRVRDAKWAANTPERWSALRARRCLCNWDNLAVEDEMHEAEVKALGTRVEGDIPTVMKAVKL
jgi:sigma54-dependent transcription regulator